MSRTLRFDTRLGAQELFDYLTDPHRRPDWQSSLLRVEQVRGAGETGSSWRDVTAVGARPLMRVSTSEPPHSWAEEGRWGPITAGLRMELLGYAPRRTLLTLTLWVRGAGPVGAVLERLAPLAIGPDVQRAIALAGRR